MTDRDRTEFLTGIGSDDFCLIHGYEHMRRRMGNPIPVCLACERGSDGEEAPGAKE